MIFNLKIFNYNISLRLLRKTSIQCAFVTLNLSKISQEMTSVECFENVWFNKKYI